MKLNMPMELSSWDERLAFVLKVREKLRRVFNAEGDAYRAEIEALMGEPWPGQKYLADHLNDAGASAETRQQTLAREAEFEAFRTNVADPRGLATTQAFEALRRDPPDAELDALDLDKLFVDA